MSKCDERFARQYRYEPPPGFPLASPSSDIVHHLSGPNRYANTQTSLLKSKSVVTTKLITFAFTGRMAIEDTHLHTCVDSLVRVSRRVIWNFVVPMRWIERTLQNKIKRDQRMRSHTFLQGHGKNRRRSLKQILHKRKHRQRTQRAISSARIKCTWVALTKMPDST